nr:hypothetical protein [Aeromicrobium sp.]
MAWGHATVMIITQAPLARFTALLASVSSFTTLGRRLCEASRIMLNASGALVTSETVDEGRTTVCWTQSLSRRLETLQDAAGEGPIIEALDTGTVVLGDFGPSDDVRDDRWPALRSRVADLDFSGRLIAIPLRSELPLRGVLMAHRKEGARTTDGDVARFLGQVVGTAVLQDPAIGAQGHVFAEVLTDRDVVHRATSELELRANLRYEDALALLRAVAYSRGEELGTIAERVVAGDLEI